MSNLSTIYVPGNDSDVTLRAGYGVIYHGLNGYGITWAYFGVQCSAFIVAIIGILLNSFALHVIRNRSAWMDVSQIFIANLARSDIVTGVLGVYVVLYNLIHYKNYHECVLRFGLIIFVNINCCAHLLLLTFDRYCRIIFPFRYMRYFREDVSRHVCRVVWLVSVTLGLLPSFGWRKPPIHGLEYCSFFGVIADDYLKMVVIIFIVFLSCMFFCYVSILCVAWRQIRRPHGDVKLHRRAYDSRSARILWWKPAKTTIILITFYCFCWLPAGFCFIMHLMGGFPSSYTDGNKGTVLAYVGSLIFLYIVGNPIIYAVSIPVIKRQFAATFCRCRDKGLKFASFQHLEDNTNSGTVARNNSTNM